MPFSPLAGGFLTGKYRRDEEPPADSRGAREERFRETYFTERNFDAIETVESVAEDVDASPTQVSLAWLLEQETVTAPVVGPRTTSQLESNVAAADLDLSEDAIERLDATIPSPY